MTTFVIKYRRGRGKGPTSDTKSNLAIEIIWTAIPFVVVGIVFWAGFAAFMDLVVAPDNAMEIKVIGRKWYWKFEYPNGLVHDSLHVPVDRPVKLVMRSEDVIHSFFVPAFRLKMDVVPGRYNKSWFTATRVGEYPIYCAEYCGTGHSDMLSTITVHKTGGYAEWLKRTADIFSPYLRPESLSDPVAFLTALRDGTRPVDAAIRDALGDETRKALDSWDGKTKPDENLTKVFLDGLNDVIDGESLFSEARFAGIARADDTKVLLAKEELTETDVPQLNRFLIADAYKDLVRRGPDPIVAGRKVYEANGCAACHATTKEGGIGPGLGGIWGKMERLDPSGTVKVDENYFRESLVNPNAKVVAGYEPRMTSYKGQFSDRQIDALIAYVRSLTEGEPGSKKE
jgi:cytochrome c oxidase subunit 2